MAIVEPAPPPKPSDEIVAAGDEPLSPGFAAAPGAAAVAVAGARGACMARFCSARIVSCSSCALAACASACARCTTALGSKRRRRCMSAAT
jgi:hypothetical protein